MNYFNRLGMRGYLERIWLNIGSARIIGRKIEL